MGETMLTLVVHDNIALAQNGLEAIPVQSHLHVLKILFVETDDNGITFVAALQQFPEEPTTLIHFTFPMDHCFWTYPSWLHRAEEAA